MGMLTRFTVEAHQPDEGWADLQQVAARAREVAEDMQREGVPVRFLRSIFLPEDDACFFLFEAPTREAVREAVTRAGLRPRHVQETIAPEVEVER
jgi:muconolactone delta-isomerase